MRSKPRLVARTEICKIFILLHNPNHQTVRVRLYRSSLFFIFSFVFEQDRKSYTVWWKNGGPGTLPKYLIFRMDCLCKKGRAQAMKGQRAAGRGSDRRRSAHTASGRRRPEDGGAEGEVGGDAAARARSAASRARRAPTAAVPPLRGRACTRPREPP